MVQITVEIIALEARIFFEPQVGTNGSSNEQEVCQLRAL